MLIHDFSDIFVSLFRVAVYANGGGKAEIFFYTFMTLNWAYFRVYFFPVRMIYTIYKDAYDTKLNPELATFFINFMSMLYVLHVFWFHMMISGVIRRFGLLGAKKSVQQGKKCV